MVDVIEQVATAKCPNRLHQDMESLEVKCSDCGSLGDAGLCWDSLSRECPKKAADCVYAAHYGSVHRVPDVTLEKVLPLIYSLEKASVAEYIVPAMKGQEYTGLWAACHSYYREGDSPQMTYYEATPLEAACAALLATVEVKA